MEVFFIFLIVIAGMGLIVFIRSLKTSLKHSNRLSQVRAGDRIKVNISGFVVEAECLNNSPETKKMFIRKFVSQNRISETVEEYNNYTFINFDALNPVIGQPNRNQSKYSTLDHLKDLLEKTLEKEKYEEASVLRDAISKLENTTKQKI